MAKTDLEPLHVYCLCGDSAHGTIRPAVQIDTFLRAWDQVHSGEGHGRTDKQTCAKARRKQSLIVEEVTHAG